MTRVMTNRRFDTMAAARGAAAGNGKPDSRIDLEEVFGQNTFSLAEMQARLPKPVFKALKKTLEQGTELDPSVADAVAVAMKEWALEKGATHFTHWFQPLTDLAGVPDREPERRPSVDSHRVRVVDR